jgi:hypothetical protein
VYGNRYKCHDRTTYFRVAVQYARRTEGFLATRASRQAQSCHASSVGRVRPCTCLLTVSRGKSGEAILYVTLAASCHVHYTTQKKPPVYYYSYSYRRQSACMCAHLHLLLPSHAAAIRQGHLQARAPQVRSRGGPLQKPTKRPERSLQQLGGLLRPGEVRSRSRLIC